MADENATGVRAEGSLEGRTAAVLLLGVAAFQLALALGAPWGIAAWGGTNPGVLPVPLRVASACVVPVYVLLAAIASGRVLHGVWARRVLTVASIYSAIGVVANLASPSWVEKLVWVPVTLALTVLLWRVARRRTV